MTSCGGEQELGEGTRLRAAAAACGGAGHDVELQPSRRTNGHRKRARGTPRTDLQICPSTNGKLNARPAGRQVAVRIRASPVSRWYIF